MELAARQLDLFSRVTRTAASTPRAVAPPALEPRSVSVTPPAARETPLTGKEARLTQARDLAHRLAGLVGAGLSVLVTVHDNRSTMVSFRRQAGVLRIRLHHMFLEAPEHIVTAIAEYAARGHQASGHALDEYIAERQERIRNTPTRPDLLAARGRCFDLKDIFDRLNEQAFQGGIRARIGWGRHTGRRRRKSIRLGVYDHKLREIRIHPALDKPDVPLFFVEFIVFHEMLHQLFPSQRESSRHVHHPRAFRDREKAFPHYRVAIAWEKDHLSELLSR